MLFDQGEKIYLFFSLFSLISSLEKSRGRFREKRRVKSTKRKSRSRDFSFWWRWAELNSCILQSIYLINLYFVLCKILRSTAKNSGYPLFSFTLSFNSFPFAFHAKKKKRAKRSFLLFWWRWAELNRRVAYSPKGLLHTYSAKNLCAKQLTDEQPAQKSAKFRHNATDGALKPFTTLMMPYPCLVV